MNKTSKTVKTFVSKYFMVEAKWSSEKFSYQTPSKCYYTGKVRYNQMRDTTYVLN